MGRDGRKWLVLLAILIVVALAAGGEATLIQAEDEAAPTTVSGQGVEAVVGTGFTYQGQLKQNGTPLTGTCDFQFSLWDSLAAGMQVGSTVPKTGVAVVGGLFTTQLDFGSSAFNGNARWLQTAVRCPAGSGAYTTLSPRQALTAAPYALYARKVPWSGVTGVPSLQQRVSGTCTAGSSIRVVNADGTVVCQAAGTGTVTGVTASAPLSSSGGGTPNISLTGVVSPARGGTGLSSPGAAGSYLRSNGTAWTSSALQAGDIPAGSGQYIQNRSTAQAGANFNINGSGTVGTNLNVGGNLIIGAPPTTAKVSAAGNINSTTGYQIGGNTVLQAPGVNNTFVGRHAGEANTTGISNTASGAGALYSNTTGNGNTAAGIGALYSNTSGSNNAASGVGALYSNATASKNTATGYQALFGNSVGADNTAAGAEALLSNTEGSWNTASGSCALRLNTMGYSNTAAGYCSLRSNTTGYENTAGGDLALYGNVTGHSNTSLGYQAGFTNEGGSRNTFVGANADATSPGLVNATAIGANARVYANNSLVLGDVDAPTNVGIGTSAPHSKLQVVGGYIQFPTTSGAAPPAGDCNAATELGRVVVRTDGPPDLYVCTARGGVIGWIGK